jgi:hypothetical protein
MSYKKRFEENLLLNSISTNINSALAEWDYVDNYTDEYGDECICGKKHIKEVCVIKNIHNQKTLHIGNECINKFFDENIVDTSKATSRFNTRLKNILKEYLKKENIEDFLIESKDIQELQNRNYIDYDDVKKISDYKNIYNLSHYYYLPNQRENLKQILNEYSLVLSKIYNKILKGFDKYKKELFSKIKLYHQAKIKHIKEINSKEYNNLSFIDKIDHIDTLMIEILKSNSTKQHKIINDIRSKTTSNIYRRLPTENQILLITDIHKRINFKGITF